MKHRIPDIAAASEHALNTVLKPKIFWPTLLCAVFIASAGASLALPNRRAVVLWFPHARSIAGSGSGAELRYVAAGSDTEALAATVVEELLLGPLDAESAPISVPSARVVSSIRSKKTLYIDVSSDILFGRLSSAGVYETPIMEPRQALWYIERALRRNFSTFRIFITIDGQEPSWNRSEIAKDS